MAQALITIVVEGVRQKALSIAASEFDIAWGYEEKLTTFHKQLEMIRARLHDAEKLKGREAVMVWLKQLKDVVGEADDVLDEVHYEMLRRQIRKRDWAARKVSSLIPSMKRLSFPWEMGHKIENINKMLTEINTFATGLGLQNEQYLAGSSDPVPADRLDRESIPYPENFEIVGRDDDQLHIIELLIQSRKEEKLTIVPIVGMGGIGKTTLAKLVYNDEKIKEHFKVRAWLCVSVKVDINTLLAKIYEAFTGKKPTSDQRVNLIKSLEEELASKRYLLVLDDVWVEESKYWEEALVSKDMYNLTCLRRNSDLNMMESTKPLFRSLRSLQLYGMHRLEKWINGVPNSINIISPVLERLDIRSCPIMLLDECHPHPLVSLEISFCSMLSIKSIQGLTSLKYLKIQNCESFSEMPNLPDQPCHSLKTLEITHCGNLTSLPCELYDCYPFLNELHLGPFSKKLESFPSLQGIDKVRNHLHLLKLIGWDHWESLPEEIQHLTSLTQLKVFGFGLRELPMWLTNMSSIQRIEIWGCYKLKKETVKQGAPQKASHVKLNGEVVLA